MALPKTNDIPMVGINQANEREVIKSTGNAAHSISGTPGQMQDRGVSDVHNALYTVLFNPPIHYLKLTKLTGGAKSVKAVFDAPSDAAATTWLDDTTLDAVREWKLVATADGNIFVEDFPLGLSRLDLKSQDATVNTFNLEAE